MSTLSDRGRSESYGSGPGEDSAFDVSSGWEGDGYAFVDQNAEKQIIQLANSRVSLFTIFKKYGIILENQYSRSGWDYRTKCPFPDHNDLRPSFGYNSTDDRFNCFGCHRSGRAVSFVAFMEGKPRISVARAIVGRVSPEEVYAASAEAFDHQALKRIIFDYADFLREFKRKNNNSQAALQYAQDVTWNLDVYLNKHAKHNTMVLSELKMRIEKLKTQLELFQE